jgi:SPX domain protein involved in polyphosphate accumulation
MAVISNITAVRTSLYQSVYQRKKFQTRSNKCNYKMKNKNYILHRDNTGCLEIAAYVLKFHLAGAFYVLHE